MITAMTPEEKREFNKNFFIRYYPDSKDTNYNRLIGVQKLRNIVRTKEVFDNMIAKVERSKEDKMDFRLRRGIRFTFVRH